MRGAVLLCAAILAVASARGADSTGTRLDQLPQSWRDDQGRAVALTELVGHRVFLSMAYTHCRRVCPTTLDQMQRMQTQLDARGEQASFVIVGYDPDNDDPQSWHHYRASRHLNRSNWHFLTGTEPETRQLAHQLGFDFWTYDTHVMHDSLIVIFNSQGSFSAAISPVTKDWSALL